jgi:16S rRNA (cytosine967-C5)-methyltransferase
MNQDFRVSYNALRRIYAEDGYSNIVINEALENETHCSPGFVRYVVKEILRRSYSLDYKIAKLSKNGMKGMKSKTKVLLRLGIFLLDEVDSIPDAVCVHEIVELANEVNRPNKGFINGILRSYLRLAKNIPLPAGGDRESLSVRYSCHPKLIALLQKQYGEVESHKILEAWNQPVPVVLRNNPLRQSREALLQLLREQGVAAEACPNGILIRSGSIIRNELFESGAYSVQGISSQLAITALAPKAGSRVLDMCAAPGGKTTGLAEIMGDTGSVTAWDFHPHRVALIQKNAKRLHLTCIQAAVNDASVFDPSQENRYDVVLADVPCSGLGTVPVKPEIKLRDDTAGYKALTNLQLQILRNAWRYVKPGGRVMYSTCTINRDENEGVIERFTAAESDAVIVEKMLFLPYNKTGFFYTIMEKPKNKDGDYE